MSAKIITFVAQKYVTMRRILLIFSLVVMFATMGNAQPKDVRFGLKVGPTFDWASSGSTATKNDGMRVGFSVGVIHDRYFNDHVAISSGVNLNLLRMKYSFTDRRLVEDFLEDANVMVSRQLKATNVEIPLKAKLRFEIFDSFSAFMEAGGGISFNIKDLAKDSYEFYWVSSDGKTYDNCSYQYRLLQLSMVFGLGAEYEINRNLSTFVQISFDHAFSNAFVNSLEKQTGSILRNNFIGVEAGIMF